MLGSLTSILSNGIGGLILGASAVLGAIGGFFGRLFGGGSSAPTPTVGEQVLLGVPSASLLDGPLLAVASGIALSVLGVSTTPSVPSTSQLTVQATVLSSIQVNSISGSMAGAPGGVALVNQSTSGAPDHVVILSPTSSPGKLHVENFDVTDSAQVVSSQKPQDGYKTFFVRDGQGNLVPNERAFAALKAQTALLNSIRTASPHRMIPTLQKAAGASHE